MSPGRASAQRRSVVVARRCNNACVFCGRPEDEAVDRGAFTRALEDLRGTTPGITLVGGEPTLRDDLPAIVHEARALGFAQVGVQTNGRALTPALAAALVEAGLTDVHVSLHGSEPAVHDYHTGVSGSFLQTIAGIAAARAAKLTVVVTTVLTRSSYRSLALVPRLLSTRGVAAWHIAVPHANGRAASAFDRVVPRLGLAVPFALHALKAAETLRLPAFVSGAPLCLLGPFATRSLEGEANAPRAYDDERACGDCPARASCPGVDPWYLERFSGDELTRRTSFERTVAHPLAPLFTGPGELAPRQARIIPESPSTTRRKLPVLARPSPGAAERRGPAKTGEALREILPALFEPKGDT